MARPKRGVVGTKDEGSVEVKGLKELDEKLQGLGNELAGKALYSALNRALTPVVKDAKKLARVAEEAHFQQQRGGPVLVRPGLLKSAIRKKRLPKKEHVGELKNGAVMGIYIGKGTKQKIFPNYWHFIEYGTATVPAYPYLAPAFDKNVEVMINIFKTTLAANIEKYAKEVGE